MWYWCVSYIMEVVKLSMLVYGIFRCERRRCYWICFIGLLSVIAFSFWTENSVALSTFVTVILIITVSAFTKRWKNALVVLFGYMAIGIADVALAGLICSVLQYDMERILSNKLLCFMVNSVSGVILLAVYVVISIVGNKRREYLTGNKKILLLLSILFMAGMAYLLPIQSWGLQNGNELMHFVSVMGVSVSFILLIVLGIMLLISMYKKDVYQKEKEFYIYQNELQKNYYEALVGQEELIKKLRHDMKGHVAIVQGLLQQGEIERVEKYLNSLNKAVEKTTSINTGNQIVNMIVKNMISPEANISLRWKGILPEALNITDMDLCTLFSNVLANAVKATRESEQEPTIYISIQHMARNLLITCKNPYGRILQDETSNLLTTKKNKKEHGYGMKSIKDVVEKYNGELDIEIQENFTMTIMLTGVLHF